jgi:hypothetical protein
MFADFNGDCLADLFITSHIPNLNSSYSQKKNTYLSDQQDNFIGNSSYNNNTWVRQYEIWINQKTAYTLKTIVPLPPGSGQVWTKSTNCNLFSELLAYYQVSVADFNGDGTLDLLIPICYPAPTCTTENSLRIVLNIQKPLCSLFGKKSSSCRAATALCRYYTDLNATFPIY